MAPSQKITLLKDAEYYTDKYLTDCLAEVSSRRLIDIDDKNLIKLTTKGTQKASELVANFRRKS